MWKLPNYICTVVLENNRRQDFMKIRRTVSKLSSGNQSVTNGRTNRQTEMTKPLCLPLVKHISSLTYMYILLHYLLLLSTCHVQNSACIHAMYNINTPPSSTDLNTCTCNNGNAKDMKCSLLHEVFSNILYFTQICI